MAKSSAFGTLSITSGVALSLLAVAIGGAAGIGAFTFVYAQGASYMTNDPASCANCHVMQAQYDAWTKSSHHAVATCNDCHTEPDLPRKLFTKSLNGFNHSLKFTTGQFHEPIRITPRNERVTEEACRHCHADIVHMIDTSPAGAGAMSCIRCHRDVGHKH